MTKAEYADYEAAVADFFKREGIQNLTSTSNSNDEEPFFSWRPCDCCGDTDGGMRENASGYNPTTGEVQEYVVCEDCIYYAEYGQLDDQTMLDMEEE